MAKLTVQSAHLRMPLPELQLGHSASYLGPEIKGWAAVADEDARMLVIRVRGADGRQTTHRVPFEGVRSYTVTSATARPDEAPVV